MAGLDCQESLPSYLDPGNVYTLALSADTPNKDDIRRSIQSITAHKGALGFSIVVKNVFDETLADITHDTLGEISIWWKESPHVMKTLVITRGDENLTREIEWNGAVSLDPGDSIHCAVAWLDIDDDGGEYMWEHLTTFRPTSEIAGYNSMLFEAQAKIVLFDQTPAVYSDIVEFRIFFYSE